MSTKGSIAGWITEGDRDDHKSVHVYQECFDDHPQPVYIEICQQGASENTAVTICIPHEAALTLAEDMGKWAKRQREFEGQGEGEAMTPEERRDARDARDAHMRTKVRPWWAVLVEDDDEQGPPQWCIVLATPDECGVPVQHPTEGWMDAEVPWGSIVAIHAPTDDPQLATAYKLREPPTVTPKEAYERIQPDQELWTVLCGDTEVSTWDFFRQYDHKLTERELLARASAIRSPGGNVYEIADANGGEE